MKSREIVQKFCKVAYIVSKVFMVLMFVCAGIMLATAVMMFAFSASELIKEVLNSSASAFELEFTPYDFGILSIADGIILLAEGIVFMYAKRYFEHELEDGTPFTHRGADEIKALGIRLLAWPFGAMVVSSVICAIGGVNMENDMSLSVGLGVALIFLSFVFHDGAEIKEKADKAQKSEKNDDSFEIHNLFD